MKQARALGVGQAARAKAGIANTFTTKNIAMLTPPSGIGMGNFGQSNFSAKNTVIPGMPFSVKYPKYTYNPKKSSKKGKNITPIEEHVEDGIIKATQLFTASIKPPAKRLKKGPMKAALNTAQGGAGAISAAAGAAFEVGISQALGLPAAKLEKGKKNLDVPTGMISASLKELFSGGRTGAMMEGITGADFKVSDSWGNARSMAEKIIDVDKTSFNKFARNRKRRGARGYVPNFAALGDAVEREAAAGVPLGSIRVNRSSRLSSPNNPAGLGVTNTRDEPQGLKNVYGAARGYVPNFAIPISREFMKLFSPSGGYGLTEKTGKGGHREMTLKKQRELARALDKMIIQYKKGKISVEQLNAKRKELFEATKLTATSEKKVAKIADKRVKAVDRLNRMQGGKEPGMMKRFGERLGGFGGMALSFGAPMLAGAVEQAGGPKEVSQGLTGVGTGAAFGMMFGPWGTAIGAAAGGLYGFTSALAASEMSLSEIAKYAAEFRKETQETKTAGQAIIQAQRDMVSATSQQELESAQKRLADNFEKIKGTELEKSFASAAGDITKMNDAVKKYTDIRNRENVLLEGTTRLGALGEDVGDFRRDFMKGGKTVTKEDLYKDPNLIMDLINKLQTDVGGKRFRTEDEAKAIVQKMMAGKVFKEGVFMGMELDPDKIFADAGLHQFFEVFLR